MVSVVVLTIRELEGRGGRGGEAAIRQVLTPRRSDCGCNGKIVLLGIYYGRKLPKYPCHRVRSHDEAFLPNMTCVDLLFIMVVCHPDGNLSR